MNDNWPTLEPYFNETGSNGPSTLPLWQQRELCELAVGSVKALGFTSVSALVGCAVLCVWCGVVRRGALQAGRHGRLPGWWEAWGWQIGKSESELGTGDGGETACGRVKGTTSSSRSSADKGVCVPLSLPRRACITWS